MVQSTEARQVALVTGAASGIGAHLAIDLAQHGWSLILVDINPDGLATTAQSIEKATGSTPETLAGDLADPAFIDRLLGDINARQTQESAPTALVNAAGIYPAIPFFELSAERWDRVQNINVRAPLLLTRGLAQQAVASGDPFAVVNITSGASLRARPGATHYCVSKSALTMTTKACAVELGPYGIRVNAVSPGFVVVDSATNPVTEEYADAVSANPLGRKGRPDDLCGAVRFLLSSEAEWVTGAVINVDGGSAAGTTALPQHWASLTAVQAGVAASLPPRRA